MGACASKPEGCVKGRIKLPKKRRHCRRRRRVSKRHVSFKDNLQFENNIDRSHFNPTFQIQGSLDVAWFDSSSIIDSERDDEFYSVRDGIIFNIFVFFFFLIFWIFGFELRRMDFDYV